MEKLRSKHSEVKASVDKDGVLSFDEVLSLRDKIIYLFLLCEQSKITLKEVRVSKDAFKEKEDKDWLNDFKKQIQLNVLGTNLVLDDIGYDELIIKIKI